MKNLTLLLFCASTIVVPSFAMEKGKEKLKDEKLKTKDTSSYKVPLSHVARAGIKVYRRELKKRSHADVNERTVVTGIPQLHWLVGSSKWSEVKKFIESTPDLDLACKDKSGRNILFKFLLGHSKDCVKGFRYFVYKCNADLTVKDKFGNTLFHEAAVIKNSIMMDELITACFLKLDNVRFAKLLAEKNKKGATALGIADGDVYEKLRDVIKNINIQVSKLKKEIEDKKAVVDKEESDVKAACDAMAGLSIDGGEDSDNDTYFDLDDIG